MDCITEELKNESGIYKITNLSNRKCYIGQSMNLEKRYRSHRNMLRSNTHHNNHLQHAYNNGDKFIFEVIELCAIDELDEREVKWIQFYDSTNRKNGYNFDSGGKVVRERHPETIQKQRKSMIEYFSDENKRIELSKKKTSIPLSVVKEIKRTLRFTDLERNIIAKHFGVNENIVTHICRVNSHYYILEEYNHYLKNRQRNIDSKKNRIAIRMYRDGCTYEEIAKQINLDTRNAIRRIKEIKTIHDDRCRLNTINRTAKKKTSLVRTLYNMGYNDTQISKLLNASRSNVWAIRNGSLIKNYDDVNKVRGKVKPFEYEIRKVNLYPIVSDGMQLAFAI